MTQSLPKYVLITAARNEEALIEATIQAVVGQNHRPLQWVIVSDGSTDRTDEIAKSYCTKHEWIHFERMPQHRDRQFAAKAHSFNAGYRHIQGQELDYDVIGNLDADITMESDYFSFLLSKFNSNPKLGVAGTPFVEGNVDTTYGHSFANTAHVSGACQMFRRNCFEEIGGYQPIRGGAIDWIAVTTARMNGWQTQTFTEKSTVHQRKIGSAEAGPLMVWLHYGRKAYYVGGHPLWEILRGIFRMAAPPYIVGGLSFIAGYLWSAITRIERPISPQLMAFHRKEQLVRLRSAFSKLKWKITE